MRICGFVVNSKLFNHLHQIKAQKFEQLPGPPITCDASLENLNVVVTIRENLSLSDADKSQWTNNKSFIVLKNPNHNNRQSLIRNKGGKFLKKLWCCVGGSITR